MKKLIIILFFIPLCLNSQVKRTLQLSEDWTLNQNNTMYSIAGFVVGGFTYLRIGNNYEKDIETFKYKYRGAAMAVCFSSIIAGGVNYMGGGEISLSGTGYMIGSGIITAYIFKRISIHRYKKKQKQFNIEF